MYAPQTTRSALQIHRFVFWGALSWRNCMIFNILWTAGRIKLVDPSRWLQERIFYGCSKICIPFSRKCPKNAVFVFSWTLKFQKFLYHENYISYQIGWPFKITERPIFLLVLNTIYTSRTKGNGQKWEFQVFFWIRISEFLSKFNSL